MLRLAGAVVGMELAALLLGYALLGWPALLAGAAVVIGTVSVLAVVAASEAPRRKLVELRAIRHGRVPMPHGLMSGFFEIPRQGGPVHVPGGGPVHVPGPRPQSGAS